MDIAFITFGCSLNQADSEAMAALLKEAGFNIVDKPEDAELVVVNSCTVKNLAETKFFKTLRDLGDNKIVIAGCIPQADQATVIERLSNYSLLGTSQLDKIVHIVQETIEGNIVRLLEKDKLRRLALPKIRKNKIIDIIPISEGCLGNCTYCKTKQARGDLTSYPIKDIVHQVEIAIKDNCKEIWLTSQDCGAYGLDTNTDLTELLERVLAVDGDFKVRLGMSNPNHIIKLADKLIELYKNPKMFKFLHIPVQSGNNEILKAMNRFYTIEDYNNIINKFKQSIPNITIATDIICGFPGETDQQFNDSLKVITETKPNVINFSKYWARPGTKAATLPQVNSKTIKQRTEQIKQAFKDMNNAQNQALTGQTTTIIIDDKGKDWIGHDDSYRHIVIKGAYKLGQTVNVKILEANEHYFLAEELL